MKQLTEDNPRFLCDAMLGSLARWLRFFGYDALFLQPGVEDLELAAIAETENRWLLTRDHELASVGPRTLLVKAADLENQLVEVFGRLGLFPEATLEHARCGECNGSLKDAAKEDVAEIIPPYVLENVSRFHRCEGCGRVYWPGTHSQRLLERMHRVVLRQR